MFLHRSQRAEKSSLQTSVWLVIAGCLLSAASLAQTVTIQSPINNGTSTSPVAVKATAQDSNPVSFTQIYVDQAV